jgi:hypothetical protein
MVHLLKYAERSAGQQAALAFKRLLPHKTQLTETPAFVKLIATKEKKP